MKKWKNKMKTYIKKHWILCTTIFFIVLPLLLNISLCLADVIYNRYNFNLSASGLENKDWLDFLGTYLSVVIAFMGICLVWKSSAEDRKMAKNEKLAKEYDENLSEEKNILIEVCQSFNTDIIYKVINELNNMNMVECRRILQNSRERILDIQVKFELLSDIADDFRKCEGCGFNPCYDRENMIAIRDLYYKIEKIYLEMLHNCSIYVDKMEQQQFNEKMMQNEEKLIASLQQYIFLANNKATLDSIDDIKRFEEEIFRLRRDIEMLKGQRLKDEELKKMASPVVKAINLISQEMKPQIISYCKSYIGWKSRHKSELLLEGNIHYIKYPECNEKTNLKH